MAGNKDLIPIHKKVQDEWIFAQTYTKEKQFVSLSFFFLSNQEIATVKPKRVGQRGSGEDFFQ